MHICIDGDILNDLSYGIDIHVLSNNHVCAGDTGIFDNFIHNENPTIRVLFISANMVNEMKIMEDVYHNESSESLDPLDCFRWYCPVCQLHYDDM